MEHDIRATALNREVEAFYQAVRKPGTGQISDASQLCVSPDGERALFAGTIVETNAGIPPTRICEICLKSGHTRVLTRGSHVDHFPKYSPNGEHVAFLSDRHQSGDFQLCLLNPVSGEVASAQRVGGWVEYIQWAPDGRRILLGVAGHGADLSGGQGAIASEPDQERTAAWMPTVETGKEAYRWRRIWIYELNSGLAHAIAAPEWNIWEATWCGNNAIAVVASGSADEGSWYATRLLRFDIQTGDIRQLYSPRDQLGCVAASPDGRYVAFVEALCSDRGLVAGELYLVETSSGRIDSVDTHGTDISYTEWRSDHALLVAGHRGFETVVGLCDLVTDTFAEVWSSSEISTAGMYVSVSGIGTEGDFALVGEGFQTAPQIAVIRLGQYRTVRSFDLGYGAQATAIAAAQRISWSAPDGLNLQGWLLLPGSGAPYALVMCLHGGPVWHWRPVCLRGGTILTLVKHGYAVFLPNPRGSAGRGREFARKVMRDMGGADAHDCLSALDYLVTQGIADPRRLGVTGASYGGFMSAWLTTQTPRFAAAIPVCPITNFLTAELTSHIPEFYRLFLGSSYTDSAAQHLMRSPVMYARNVTTPTLNICGALDRATTADQAVQFHHALLGNKVNSVLITYPQEGHGIRKLPTAIDYVVRVVSWFQQHMPAKGSTCEIDGLRDGD